VLGAVLQRCAVLVGNDGGAMHLAAAVGCPAVSLIPGIEFPGSVDPWGYSHLSVRHPTQCSPCYSFTYCPLGHQDCMREITVDAVLEKCAKALALRQQTSRSGGARD
jgi:ADP-heptose:LPS heptosyltransferase